MEPQAAPQPQTLPVPPTPPTPQTKNSLILIMSILLIVTVAIAGLFYFQIQKLSKDLSKYQIQPSPVPSLSPTPINIPTTDPKITTSWKTINFKDLTFKIPPTWKPGYCAYLDIDGTVGDFGPPEKDPSKCEDSGVFQVIRYHNLPLASDGEISKVPIVISGIVGTKTLIENSAGSKTEISFNKNNVYYQINFYEKTYQEVFDQILSTFKLIESTPSASPTTTPASLQ